MRNVQWILGASFLLAACSGGSDTDTPTLTPGDSATPTAADSTPTAAGNGTPTAAGNDTPTEAGNATPTAASDGVVAVDPSKFLSAGLATGTTITEEACTLSGGTETTCYRIVTKSQPTDHSMGPFCPPNISSDASEGGIWAQDDVIHDVDGAFIANLPVFYSDDNWQLYDSDTGDVYVTDSYDACEGAAKPDVEEQYQNHCVECDASYIDDEAVMAFVIPKNPVYQDTPEEAGQENLGVAFNGVEFAQAAPVEAILAAYTIAPFDDCGGHVNLHNGYHYHRATGCSTEETSAGDHAPMIGYALDGFGIYALEDGSGNEPTDLDECRGHTDASLGYHYHVAGPDEPYFIGCFHGEIGCSLSFESGVDSECSADGGGPPGGGPPGKAVK